MSNVPAGYSDDGDAATHGEETAIYQELLKVRAAYSKWRDAFKSEFPNKMFSRVATSVDDQLFNLSEELNQPL